MSFDSVLCIISTPDWKTSHDVMFPQERFERQAHHFFQNFSNKRPHGNGSQIWHSPFELGNDELSSRYFRYGGKKSLWHSNNILTCCLSDEGFDSYKIWFTDMCAAHDYVPAHTFPVCYGLFTKTCIQFWVHFFCRFVLSKTIICSRWTHFIGAKCMWLTALAYCQ